VILLLLLRWRLFLNSMRRQGRAAELGFQLLWLVLGAGFVMLTSLGFFAGTIGLLRIDKADLLDIFLWAIFLVWQLAPILFEGYSPGLSFREVARYPISFRLYVFLSIIYGISDPAAVTALLWLFSMWLGVVFARPEWALTAALPLLLFAAFNLLLNRVLIGLFERFQSTRKGRERMVFLLFMFIILINVLQLSASNWRRTPGSKLPPWVVHVVATVREVSPPGVALRGFRDHGLPELYGFAVLVSYGGLAYLLLRRQLRSLYQGEIYAEAYTVRRELKVRKGWSFPLVDEVTSAIMEKELRYIRQSARMLLQLIYPPVIFLVIAFNGPGWKMLFVGRPQALLPGVAGFMLLSVPNLAYNIFGMDKEGFGRWLLAPLPLRKVLLAKNLTHGGILCSIYLVMAVIVIAITHVGLPLVLTVTVVFLTVLVVQLSAGNLISVYWPRRIELTQMSSKLSSNAAGLVSMLVFLPLGAVIGGVTLAARYWQLPWLPLLCAVVALAASLKLHSFLLDRAVRHTWEHIEEITGNLGA
jgi:hypothetical protein